MAKDFYGLPCGQVIVALGPPKTGKSSFAGSMAEVVPSERIALLCTKPNEANSFMYRKHGLTGRAEIFMDSGWDPELGSFKATAWLALQRRLKELSADPNIDGIIIDSGTDSMDLLSHESLSGMQVAGKVPGSTGDLRVGGAKDASFAYYDKMKNGAQRFMTRLVEAAMNMAAPKFIIIPWHTQAPSEEEQAKEGISHEGKVLPMIEGKYRQKLAGDCDVVVYTDVVRKIEGGKPVVKHVIQIGPTNDKHAAIRGVKLPAEATLPNEFAALHALLKGG